MKNTGFIARRYLFSRKHVSLISTLTMISIIGVTIGTALLIVVLSVFNGFYEVIKDILLTNDPDIRIESAETKMMPYDPSQVEELEGIPEVKYAAAFSTEKALLAYEDTRDQVVDVKGIQPEEYLPLNNIQQNLTEGAVDLDVRDRRPGMLISQKLKTELGVDLGEEIVLLSAEGMRKSLTQFSLPRTYRFEVRGVYNVEQVVDDAAVYIDFEAAQRLFEFRNEISAIDLRLEDSDLAESIKPEVEEVMGAEFNVSTWYDLQRPLYDVMNLEKWAAYVILMIIVLVAVLNIIGSLTMIVIQKRRDIGVLLTMGYTPRQIKQIFLKQGFYIGMIGCGIGGGLGLLISWLQQQYGFIKLSSAFIIEAYPVNIEPFDITIVLLGSLFLCIAATWYPSTRAAAVEPADAVRYE